MNFQQLRIIREAVRRGFNLSEVATALATSQSGVSKHIRDLEYELGVEIFLRRGKRLLGLTEPGKELVPFVERVLLDTGNIKRLADEFRKVSEGELVIATTHTQARYTLTHAVAKFREQFPDVRLVLHQGSPSEIAALLIDGRADLGIATEAVSNNPELAAFPFYSWRHVVIVGQNHPLASSSRLTLEELGEYPIITYHEGFTGRPGIDRAFEKAGVKQNIVMAALDADVIKEYVKLGLGVGIVAAMAVSDDDAGLVTLPSDHLFDESTSYIAVRRGRFLRGYAYRFIEICQPALSEAQIVREAGADRN